MKIALCQTNPTVGDLAGNAAKILDFSRRAASDGAELALFPELALVGYPPRDLLLKPAFLADEFDTLRSLASQITGIAIVVGFASRDDDDPSTLRNSAAVIAGGRVTAVAHKQLLPAYDVFDEKRYFVPGCETLVLDLSGVKIALTICEDAWNDSDFWQSRPSWSPRKSYPRDPVAEAASAGADVILNLSASPFQSGKSKLRAEMFTFSAKKHSLPVAFVNQVGGNDELIFPGRALGVSAAGIVTAACKLFEEDICIFDTGSTAPVATDSLSTEEEFFRALVLGTRDYLAKCGFSSAIVGLSGGIDSALVACIAANALGAENVTGVLMPSMYSSDHSVADAERLVANLGIKKIAIPIADLYRSFESALSQAFSGAAPGLAEENLQARIRGTVLMALSNKFGGLVLSTGNKSEVSVGYCTLYGDMAGGLDVLGDLPKTQIYRVARWLNRSREIIPASSITKPPSAELRPGQTDQDSLPPYDLLDQILKLYVEDELPAERIVEKGFDPSLVAEIISMVDRNEYKRKQAAPVLKVTGRAFGFGRRMPIAQKYVQKLPKGARP